MGPMADQLPEISEVQEAFAFLEDWEDRYRYIMDLGEKLPPMPEQERADRNLIHGCQSTVWVCMSQCGEAVVLSADSDSKLVKGLAAIVVIAVSGQGAAKIARSDLEGLFDGLHLHEHLSPTRSNGLHGMIQQVRGRAAELVAAGDTNS